MKLFLLWDSTRRRVAPDMVRERMERLFQPLLAKEPTVHEQRAGDQCLLAFELPVQGWTAPFVEEDEETWALAVEYPLNVQDCVRTHGGDPRAGCLLQLARGLQRDPEPWLRDLAAPFVLVWLDKREGRFYVQNDALGLGQLFEATDGPGAALTSRLMSLSALDVPFAPEPLDWATRFTLGWFPLDTTGFAHVRYADPGSRYALDTSGLRKSTCDVLADWVVPEERTPTECCELALQSMVDLTRAAMANWTQPSLGLSGGWDSRVLAATLRHLGSDFQARVRGGPARYDVMISSMLAEIAGFDLRIKTRSGLPPDTLEGCRAAIEKALRWQAGTIPEKKHKLFLGRKKGLDGGVVNVTGQHGGVGKSDFVVRIDALQLAPERYEDVLVEKLAGDLPSSVRADLHDGVRERIRSAYRQADRYGLTGLARLHFFYLYEFTRRWGSATVNGQTGLVFAPFVGPDFVRAAYAFPPAELPTRPFHRHIVQALAPDWAEVIYEDQVTEEDFQTGRIRPVELEERKTRDFDGSKPWLRPRAHRKFSTRTYWLEVGKELLREAVAEPGFHQEVFDAESLTEPWKAAPDSLAIAYLLERAWAAGG